MQSEVNFLGRLLHPNLVRLLGYCWEDKELLLVYEYMAKGSLENHLFRSEPRSKFPFRKKKKKKKKKSLCSFQIHGITAMIIPSRLWIDCPSI